MNLFRFVVASLAGTLAALCALAVFLATSPWMIVRMLTQILSRFLEPKPAAWPELVEFDPQVGWKSRPNLDTYHSADDDNYRTTTDAEGWRGKTSLDASEVVVFGDSYIYGHAVSDAHFFADLNPKLRVKAVAVSGYNMVQEFIWVTRLAPRLRGKLAVWSIYLGNDLTDSLVPAVEGYRIPFVREGKAPGQWEIVTSHLGRTPWPSGPRYHHVTFYERVAKLFVPGPFALRAYSACEYMIAEGARLLRASGSQLVVVTVPSKNMLIPNEMRKLIGQLPKDAPFDVNYPDHQIRDICQRCNVPFVAGKDHLQAGDYRQAESHWTDAGHRKVAALLADIYSKHSSSLASRDGGSLPGTGPLSPPGPAPQLTKDDPLADRSRGQGKVLAPGV